MLLFDVGTPIWVFGIEGEKNNHHVGPLSRHRLYRNMYAIANESKIALRRFRDTGTRELSTVPSVPIYQKYYTRYRSTRLCLLKIVLENVYTLTGNVLELINQKLIKTKTRTIFFSPSFGVYFFKPFTKLLLEPKRCSVAP